MKNKKILLITAATMTSCLFLQNAVITANNDTAQPSVNQNQPDSTVYTATLKVKTDGVENNAGGSLSAKNNQVSGREGAIVELVPVTNQGYRFVGYTSFRDDNGMSTDGLMPIENNRFSLSEKIGNVTVYANYERITDDTLYFSDDFSVFNPQVYTLTGDSNSLRIEDERLLFPSTTLLTLAPQIDRPIALSDTVGYKIALQFQQLAPVKPWNTVRILFRQLSDGSYYALEFSGKRAYIKKIATLDAGVQDGEIVGTPVQLELGGDLHRFVLTALGNKISVTDNDSPLLSYTSDDNFSNGTPFVAFQTVSTGRTIAIDKFTVNKVQEKKTLNVISRIDGVEDTAGTAGIVALSNREVNVGDKLAINVTTKRGYRFVGFKDSSNNVIDLESYTVPSFDATELSLYADFTIAESVTTTARNYYVDYNGGDDANDGTENSPFRTLKALHDKELVPGDRILLKSGTVYNGLDAELKFRGSGTNEQPIYVGSYGEGAKPVLNGEGKVENVVSLYNQEYITIENLEITNLSPDFATSFGLNANNNKTLPLRAINVSAKNFGVVHNIILRNLYIHDINGKLNMKWNGGIFFDIQADVVDGQITGVPTKYDGVLIENNIIERVDRSALKLVSSAWSNQSLKNNPKLPLNWYPSTNVVIRNNRIDKVGGDAITTRDTDGALIEYNKVSDSRYQNTGYNAGIWPFQATNTVIQYNEVYRTRGVQDGQGLDTDHVSSNTVMQYNYSHDNEGGFMLVMNGFPHVSPTIRYNISQNDKDKTIEFSRGTPAGTVFYNNTIYSDSKLAGRAGIIDMPNTQAGTGNREVFFFNNIFYYPENEEFFVLRSDAARNLDKFRFYNNAYYGVVPPQQETKAITGIDALTAVSSIPQETDSLTPRAGKYLNGELDVYKLGKEDTKLVSSGVSLQEAIEHFYKELNVTNKNPISENERVTLSPTEIFELASSRSSVDAIAQTYPNLSNVTYNTDFFGRTLPTTNLSIGAAQFPEQPTPELKMPTITAERGTGVVEGEELTGTILVITSPDGKETRVFIPDGKNGRDGRDGVDGAQGPVGPAGRDGRDGVDGAPGPVGPAGRDGRDGVDGAPGPVGPAGRDGRDGIDGAPGPVGPAGRDGRDGVDGAPGPVGSAGKDGRDGVDGAPGSTGRGVMSGTVDPTAEQGDNGDIYIQTATGAVFNKVDGSWVEIGSIRHSQKEVAKLPEISGAFVAPAQYSQPTLEYDRVEIPFKTIIRENPNLDKGNKRVIQEGVVGTKLVLTEVYDNQGEKLTKKLSDVIERDAQDEIVEIGVGALSSSETQNNQTLTIEIQRNVEVNGERGQHVITKDSTGKETNRQFLKTNAEVSDKQSQKQTVKKETPKSERKQPQKALPQTGETKGGLVAIVGSLFAVLGSLLYFKVKD